MTEFNPLVGTIMGSAQVQQADIRKQIQVRRSQAKLKNFASDEETQEHQVESSEEVTAIHDQEHKQSGQRDEHVRRHPPSSDEEPAGLDITA